AHTDLDRLRGRRCVDHFQYDLSVGIDSAGGGDDRIGRKRRFSCLRDELVVEITFDVVPFDLDADVVPLAGLDRHGLGLTEFSTVAVLCFLKSRARISPTADVPEAVCSAILSMKQDEES